MESRDRFSGILSLIARFNMRISAIKIVSIFITIFVGICWIANIFYYIFMSGKQGYATDYLKFYTHELVYYLSEQFPGGKVVTSMYVWLDNQVIPADFLAGLQHNEPQATAKLVWVALTNQHLFHASIFWLCAIPVLSFGAWLVARQERHKQTGERWLQGAVIMQAKKLSKELKKSLGKGIIRLGNGYNSIIVPVRVENLSFLLVAKSQQGKTVIINNMISTILKRTKRVQNGLEKMLIWCYKPGDFVSNFYTKDQLIFCPGDSRTIGFTLMRNIYSVGDFATISNVLCPDKSDKGPWNAGGRDIIEGLFKYAKLNGIVSNSDLWSKVFNRKMKDYYNMLLAVPGCERVAGLLSNPTSATCLSFYITVMVAIKPLELLSKCDGDWTIREWLESSNKSIFIVSTSELEKMLQPVHTLFVELIAGRALAIKQNRSRRIWFFLDELANLNRLNSLTRILNVGASCGLTCVIGVQNLCMLDEVYNEEGRRNIVNGTNITIIGCVKDDQTATELSTICGKAEIEETKQNFAVAATETKDSTTTMSQTSVKPLVLPDVLKNLRRLNFFVQVSGYGAAKINPKFIEYPVIAAAFDPDPRYSLEQMQIEYDELMAEAAKLQQKPVLPPSADGGQDINNEQKATVPKFAPSLNDEAEAGIDYQNSLVLTINDDDDGSSLPF